MGNLTYRSVKAAQDFFDSIAGDVLCGVGGVYLGLEVERWSGGAQGDGGYVFLYTGLQAFDELGGASGTHYHHAGGQRIECPGVSYFEFLDAEAAHNGAAHAFHRIEGCPAPGLSKYMTSPSIQSIGRSGISASAIAVACVTELCLSVLCVILKPGRVRQR